MLSCSATNTDLTSIGSTENPLVLQLWMQAKDAQKGVMLLENGTTLLEAPRQIFLTQDTNTSLFSVTVSRFVPGPDDTTAFTWTDAKDGELKAFEMPPYYISDMAEARVNLRRYIYKARREYLNALLTHSNPLIRRTFLEAERFCKISKVRQTFKILRICT